MVAQEETVVKCCYKDIFVGDQLTPYSTPSSSFHYCSPVQLSVWSLTLRIFQNISPVLIGITCDNWTYSKAKYIMCDLNIYAILAAQIYETRRTIIWSLGTIYYCAHSFALIKRIYSCCSFSVNSVSLPANHITVGAGPCALLMTFVDSY